MQDIQSNEKQIDIFILSLLKAHLDNVKVNEEEFLDLLKHSLSLNTMEKKRVVDAVPTLSQFQFDELSKVFSEERIKFRDLAEKHPDDIKKLVKKQRTEWQDLWDLYVAEKENKVKQDEDASKIDDIKSSFWL